MAQPAEDDKPVIEGLDGDEVEPDADQENDDMLGGAKANRSEKKSRKAMQKLGMRPVGGISRVVIKKSKNIILAISQPDVYVTSAENTYIIFGEAKLDDPAAQAQENAANEFAQHMPEGLSTGAAKEDEDDEDDDEEIDETGLTDDDIRLVMDQGSVSRKRAVKALKEDPNHDIVNAIMSLAS